MAQLWRRLLGAIGATSGSHPGPQVLTGVSAVIGVPAPHVLTWGTGRHDGRPVTAVAVDEGLALVGADGEAAAVAWHEVVRGGWRESASALWWSFLDEHSDEVELDRPGDLPEVFNDRVTASIVVREPVRAAGGTVVIAGRRRLGSLAGQDILWTAIAGEGADLTDPDTERQILERTAELRKEWR